MKPSLLKSPVAWFRRKLRLKIGDAVGAMGYKPVGRVDFSNMAGQDFTHVIDVGVADGTPDLYARFPDAYLDLFEPHPVYQDHLAATVLRQRPGRLHRMGLGSAEGSAALYLKGRTGSSMSADRGEGQVEVPVRRLDQVLSAADIRRPSLLKVDTEGYELEVFKGASGLMDHIDCIVSEVHFTSPKMYRPRDLILHLDGLGFEMCEMLDHHAGDGRVWCADFVFRRISDRPV
jgi:FkbM family methyltransferase